MSYYYHIHETSLIGFSTATSYCQNVFLHQTVHGSKKSSKGKYPWIEYNGQEVADTSFCIRFLNKAFNVDLNAEFTEEEKAIAHAWQKMIEENTYWYVSHLVMYKANDKIIFIYSTVIAQITKYLFIFLNTIILFKHKSMNKGNELQWKQH